MEVKEFCFTKSNNLKYNFISISTQATNPLDEYDMVYYFLASEIRNILEYEDHDTNPIKNFVSANNKFIWSQLSTLHKEIENIEKPKNLQPAAIFLNQNGLLELIQRSTKPFAANFRKYINEKVLSIFDGRYVDQLISNMRLCHSNQMNEMRLCHSNQMNEMRLCQNNYMGEAESFHNNEMNESELFYRNQINETKQIATLGLEMSNKQFKRKRELEMLTVIPTINRKKNHMTEVYEMINPITVTIGSTTYKKYKFVRTQERGIKQAEKRIKKDEYLYKKIYQRYNTNNSFNLVNRFQEYLQDKRIQYKRYYRDFFLDPDFPILEAFEKIIEEPQSNDTEYIVTFNSCQNKLEQTEPSFARSITFPQIPNNAIMNVDINLSSSEDPQTSSNAIMNVNISSDEDPQTSNNIFMHDSSSDEDPQTSNNAIMYGSSSSEDPQTSNNIFMYDSSSSEDPQTSNNIFMRDSSSSEDPH